MIISSKQISPFVNDSGLSLATYGLYFCFFFASLTFKKSLKTGLFNEAICV